MTTPDATVYYFTNISWFLQHHRLWAQIVIEQIIDKVVHDDILKQLHLDTSTNRNNKILKFNSHDMSTLMIMIAILQVIHSKHWKEIKFINIIVASSTRKLPRRPISSIRIHESIFRFKFEKEVSANSDLKIGSHFLSWWALSGSTGAKGTLIKYFEVILQARHACNWP